MHNEKFPSPFGNSNQSVQRSAQSFPNLNKSKLDKAQARRLKMPKRNRSAYFLFSMDTRARLKAEMKDQLTPLEMQAKVSQFWRELSPAQKEVYETRAKEEKLEYLVAMDKFYSNLTPETLAKSKSTRPKKPCSAYAHFVRDIKIDLKRENPRLIMQEILHIASEKWKNLNEETRQCYEKKAITDKEQYMAVTRKESSSIQGIPKKKKHHISQGNEKYPSKKSEKNIKKDLLEENISKQIKTENLSIHENILNREQPLSMLTKIEESRDSNTTKSIINPNLSAKVEYFEDQNGAELTRQLIADPNLRFEPALMGENMGFFGGMEQLEIPNVNNEFLQQNMMQNMNVINPGMDYNMSHDRMREAMAARLSWIRLAQANKSVEEELMRKIAEVKTLQAQRMMFVKNMFWPPNSGPF